MSHPNHLTRRRFLAGMAAASTVWIVPARAFGANERPQIGMVGLGGRGKAHIKWVMDSGGEVVGVYDPDKSHMDGATFKDKEGKVLTFKPYPDLRKLLEEKSIDAVVMATPNHWHALGTIWACQAGKDVYVEKPACHSIWEGRKMVEAARKYKRIVQVGTQQRSDPAFIETRQLLEKKELGEIQWTHSLWYEDRGSIGKTTTPTPVPDTIDYDAWCGPRPKVPLMRKKLHYDWHWIRDYGNGDMGNRVIHVIDDIHHVLQMNGDVPTRMMAVGGRFKYDDDANTPNSEFIVMQWKFPIVFSSQNLPNIDAKTGKPAGSAVYRRFGKGHRFTNLIKCEKGFFAVSRGGGALFDNDGNRIRQIKGDGGGNHMKNFFDAMRSRRHEDLRADVEQSYLGCLLLHTGDISCMIGKPASVDEVSKAVEGTEEGREVWKQTVELLKANGVDPNVEKPTLGPLLTFDPKTEKFTGDFADEANKRVREEYREPYTIPDRV